jgi:hypothetical protein
MACALVPAPLERIARDFGVPAHASAFDVAPSTSHGFVAKARLEVDDGAGIVVVRALVAGATADEAIEYACARVRDQLEAMVKDPIASGGPTAGQRWTFGRAPTHRPHYVNKPAVDRSLVRTKTYRSTVSEPDEAIRFAALRDVDFHVFASSHDGLPAVVRRSEANDWETVEPAQCRLDSAIEMLDVSHARFVFFRAGPVPGLHAVYRRFDGDYALLSPA